MKMTVAQVLARYLHDAGVRKIFGVSGHSIFDITDAIYLESDLDMIPAQIELSAAYMATAYARATRGLSACLVSAGAGATNAVTGVAQAWKESSPVLVISSEVNTEKLGRDRASWHEVPQEEIFRPITKLSTTLHKSEDILRTLHRATTEALSGRMGPVYFGIPRDLQVHEVEVPSPPWPMPHRTTPSAVDVALLDRAADELTSAKAPIIILGGGAHWSDCAEDVRELAELLQAPLGTTPHLKGMVSEEHPLSVGVLGFGAFPFANPTCAASDVVLAIGTTFSEALTLDYRHRVIPHDARIIQIDLDPAEIGRNYPVQVGIVADARATVRALIERVRGRPVPTERRERADKLAAEKAAWREELERRGAADGGVITPWHVYHALKSTIPPRARLVIDGEGNEFTARFFAEAPIYSGGDLRAIGHGVSSAIALKQAEPERPVVCLSGDGAFMMEVGELATATREGLPIPFIIIRNNAYGNMKRDQVRTYDGRVIGTDLLIPDLLAYGQSLDMQVQRAERPAQLAGAFKSAFSAPGPSLVDVVCPIEGL
jgi:acetolactate synthase-1/2/3 large subunit